MEISHLKDYFCEVSDPRLDRMKRHDLLDIIILSICAVLSGAESFVDIETFGRAKQEWLKEFLVLSNGIPSHDTINRVFQRLNPEEFEQGFINWVNSVRVQVSDEIVAIDGKTLRRSFDKSKEQSPLHIVSAWAGANELVLGQVAVSDKSNEITAIPKLLKLLELEGCVVTIDAMGCQKKIAQSITEQKADYVLAVKANQPTLEKQVQQIFKDRAAQKYKYHKTEEQQHGRFEKREYYITSSIESLTVKADWDKIKSVGMVKSTRTTKEKTTTEIRYYITSLDDNAELFAHAVRSHWAIENKLHWMLDVSFREDSCRVRTDYAPQNLATIRKIALNLIKQDKSSPRSFNGRKLLAT